MAYFITYLIFINILAFAFFGMDKAFAKKHAHRISERTLFFLAVIGGSLGAQTGMLWFHHKIRVFRFKHGIPAIFLIQTAIILYQIFK